MTYDFSKFISAQEHSYQTALAEMKAGHKTSHWIWYIFPQLKQLGKSQTAVYYGIENLDEARAYLENEILRNRLIEISRAVSELPGGNIRYIMGSRTDELKLCSCMTLFHLADPTIDVFKKVLDKYFDGNLDEKTVKFCEK